MSQPSETPKAEAPKNAMQRILDVVEKVGNKVPHPAIIFLILIAMVVALSALLEVTGARVTYEVIVPQTRPIETGTGTDVSLQDTGVADTYPQTIDEKKYKIERREVAAQSLLTTKGIRFIYSS